MLPLDLAQWDPGLRHIADDMNGKPINVHRLMAQHPELLRAWWDLRNYVVAGGELSQRHTEIVILVVAHAMQNAYEWDSHVDRGLAAGLTAAEIEAVRSGGFGWEPQDAVLIAVVRALLEQHEIPEALRKDAARFFSEQALMDIIAVHGAYIVLACLLNTFPVPLDDSVEARLASQGESVARLRFSPGS